MNTPPDSFARRLRNRLAKARFFTFSALLHIAIIIMGGSVVLIKDMTEPPDFVAETGTIIATDPAASMPPTAPPMPSEIQPLPPANPTAPPVSMIASTAPTNTFTAIRSSAPGTAGKTIENIAGKVGDLGTKPGAAMAKGGTAMQFFGVKTTANNVVVVVDVSGSMIGGTKSVKTYEVLEREIGKLIKDLGEQNSFGLVAFSRDAEPYKAELTRATREEKERAYNWLKRISPEAARNPRASEEVKAFHKGTRADLGLKRAFEMQPDVIFFVSDGEPTGANPAQIIKQVEAAQANLPRPATVHTIAYLADSGQPFMRDLAQKNGGSFREVNPKDVR